MGLHVQQTLLRRYGQDVTWADFSTGCLLRGLAALRGEDSGAAAPAGPILPGRGARDSIDGIGLFGTRGHRCPLDRLV